MSYHQQAPNEVLKKYVRCFWGLDNDSSKNLNYTILPVKLVALIRNEMIHVFQG
jgi:hypothetical protein